MGLGPRQVLGQGEGVPAALAEMPRALPTGTFVSPTCQGTRRWPRRQALASGTRPGMLAGPSAQEHRRRPGLPAEPCGARAAVSQLTGQGELARREASRGQARGCGVSGTSGGQQQAGAVRGRPQRGCRVWLAKKT